MSYPKEDGVVTNFYRTEDGGKAFEPVILHVHKEEGKSCKRVIQFIQDAFAIINPQY